MWKELEPQSQIQELPPGPTSSSLCDLEQVPDLWASVFPSENKAVL